MSYPPPGGSPDPYQPQQPYGQQPYGQQPNEPPPFSDPYASPSSGAPSSGQPYPPPQAYNPPPQYGTGPAYQQPYGGPMVATTNTMAILALVFAFIFAPASIFLGHIAKKQIRQTGEQGDGLATAGLVLGYIFTGIGVLFCGLGIIGAIADAGSNNL
jgi:hypothetical protein